MDTPDISGNRHARKWTRKELFVRFLWYIAHPLFAWSPQPFWAWRRFLLRAFGACIGREVNIHPSIRIEIPWNLTICDKVGIGSGAILYALGPIKIEKDATVSQYAHLCAGSHDFRKPDMPLLKPSIEVGAGAWICADAFIGPGVSIGKMAVVGARAVVVRDVPDYEVVAGNPARSVGRRT